MLLRASQGGGVFFDLISRGRKQGPLFMFVVGDWRVGRQPEAGLLAVNGQGPPKWSGSHSGNFEGVADGWERRPNRVAHFGPREGHGQEACARREKLEVGIHPSALIIPPDRRN